MPPYRQVTRRQFMQDELCESGGLPPDCANLIIAYVGPEASLSVGKHNDRFHRHMKYMYAIPLFHLLMVIITPWFGLATTPDLFAFGVAIALIPPFCFVFMWLHSWLPAEFPTYQKLFMSWLTLSVSEILMLLVVFFAATGDGWQRIGWYCVFAIQSGAMFIQVYFAQRLRQRLGLSFLTIFPKARDPDRVFLQRVDEEIADVLRTTDFHEIKPLLYQPENWYQRRFHPETVKPAETVLKLNCHNAIYGTFSFLVKDTREVRFAIYSKFYGASTPSVEDDVYKLLTETTNYEFGREKAGDFHKDLERPIQRDPMLFLHVLSFPILRHHCTSRIYAMAYQRCCCCRPFKMACAINGQEQEHMIRLRLPLGP